MEWMLREFDGGLVGIFLGDIKLRRHQDVLIHLHHMHALVQVFLHLGNAIDRHGLPLRFLV